MEPKNGCPCSDHFFRVGILFFVIFACGANTAAGQESSELKLLDRLVGSWNFQFGENEFKSTGEFKAEWILENTFIQMKGFIKNPDGSVTKTTSLITYVADKKIYRKWTFTSAGVTSVGDATWDAEKRVLTEVREDDQFTVTTTTDWSKDDSDSWKMVFTDKNTKKVLMEMSGSNVKKSENNKSDQDKK